MDEVLSEIGDLVFSLVIGYIGALEFLYVMRHLYHWSFRHATRNAGNDADSLKQLQENICEQLSEAEEREMLAGAKTMKDGVLYRDGFRIDPQQSEIDKLKHQQRTRQTKEERRKDIEAELTRQRQIEEETRKQLEIAEAILLQQRQEAEEVKMRKEAADNERKLIEAERQREEEQRRKEVEKSEIAENERKLIEAERQREEEQRSKEAEEEERAENERKIIEAETEREEEQRRKEEEEKASVEFERKLIEAEKQREEYQRRKETEEKEKENERKLIEAERKREEEQRRMETEENERVDIERKLIVAEKQREDEQRRKQKEENEIAENERRLIEAERQREEEQRKKEADEREIVDIEKKSSEIKKHHLTEQEDEEEGEGAEYYGEIQLEEEISREEEEYADREYAENEQTLFDYEQEREEAEAEQDHQRELEKQESLERKQKLIEENARKFLEAEQEMVELQQKMMEVVVQQQTSVNLESAPNTPVVEEPCIKKIVPRRYGEHSEIFERPIQTVKTQFGQTSNDPYSLNTKTLNFPEFSDECSSIEPNSSPKSSYSTQPSDDVTTGTEELAEMTAMQFPQTERQEPDGEDNAPVQYTEDYLRSLDGIKHRPLVREDGSGRRRAFKKRRSSGSSNSSRESRTSREEEVKMFTSLEEEEMQSMQKGVNDYEPIKYSGESTLKVKGHHRRHKRSPAKDVKADDDNNSVRESLEMLGEENTDPWGEVVPEHYKETDFWRREKAVSIDEEEIELEKPIKNDAELEDEDQTDATADAATHIPKTCSFEEATHTENEDAITALQKQHSKDIEDHGNDTKSAIDNNKQSDTKSNLQTSQNTEENASSARSSASPRLRRSPRIDEMNQYEDRWKESEASQNNTAIQPPDITNPTIIVHQADKTPWRDQHGLMMEGLSDFYDFTASVNPSRSRSTSRNPSPVNSPPTSPMPKNVFYNTHTESVIQMEGSTTVDIYDDTGNIEVYALQNQNMSDVIEALRSSPSLSQSNSQSTCENLESCESFRCEQNVADDAASSTIKEKIQPMLFINVSIQNQNASGDSPTEINELVQTLRSERTNSRSRSRSPLPTSDNIERFKLIKQNEDIFEKLVDSSTNIESSHIEPSGISDSNEREEYSRDNMNTLVEILRFEQSRSRSRSPLPSAENMQRSLESPKNKLIQHNDEVFEKLSDRQSATEDIIPDTPTISIEYAEADILEATADPECSREHMTSLVESLRRASSRSRSKSPMRIPIGANLTDSVETFTKKLIEKNDEQFSEQLIGRTKTPELPSRTVECVYEEIYINDAVVEHGRSRSRTPSRSISTSPNITSNTEDVPSFQSEVDGNSHAGNILMEAMENRSDDLNDHTILNLEGLQNSEEAESTLARRQRSLDKEELQKLKTANEGIELRTLTLTDVEFVVETEVDLNDTLYEENMKIFSSSESNERLKRQRCSPTTPDYDRTISEERRDVQRIKNDLLTSGFKRSTYVGESMDLGSEYEHLRRAAAHFRRSQSPSRSIIDSDLEDARRNAADNREIQNQILSELITSKGSKTEENNNGTNLTESLEGRSFSTEARDTQRIKDELLQSDFRRSTYVGESIDLEQQFENMRRETSEFRRSRSKSRSPLDDQERKEIAAIEVEAEKREFQDKLLDEIDQTSVNFEDFSRHLNAGFLDNERRASDSALIQRPEILIQFQDSDSDLAMDPDDYHHFRRFSLNQEQPVEEYPSDDYVFVSQIEVRTSTGTRTWIREDYYSDNFDDISVNLSNVDISQEVSVESMIEDNEENAREEEYTDGSEDERQTVVEVEDEIDEDICDFSERGPAEESQHEQSECEEAEREMDRYADRGVDDWQDDVENVNELLDLDEAHIEDGAIGGLDPIGGQTDDSDSVVIDQIYEEATKNRKQSGILRDYDNILQEMQNNCLENGNEESTLNHSNRKSKGSNGLEHCVTFLENERRDHEVRYLGDANISARQSTRLRSRYGYVPLLQGKIAEDINVDLNYKPKREYNWRKNFKLDENDEQNTKDDNIEHAEYVSNDEDGSNHEQLFDLRKYSLGGESITIFSRSPENETCEKILEDDLNRDDVYAKEEQEVKIQKIRTADIGHEAEGASDKPKKKKTKKKLRRSSKGNCESRDEDDSESQIYSRRSSSIQMETDSPQRKSHSRCSSKSSITNEESSGLFSPRGSVGCAETYANISEEYVEVTAPMKKKTKKRKKARDTFAPDADIKEENAMEAANETARLLQPQPELNPIPVSTAISPESASLNLLSTLSPQNSICVTPASTDSEKNEPDSKEQISTATTMSGNSTITATTSTTTSSVDSFDILKDANFYPLF